MPTIGRAEIDVDYDGDDLPRQARQIGERAGEAQAEAFDKEVQKGAKDTNADLAKDAEKNGKESGERRGNAFADAQDRVLKQRTRKLADELAKVFDDDDGVKRFTDNYKGAGDATDNLRSKVEDLRRVNGLSDDDYAALSKRIDGHIADLDRQARSTDDLAETTRRNHDAWLRQLDEDDRARVYWADQVDLSYRKVNDSITRNVEESNRRIDEMTDRFNRDASPAVTEFGNAADRADPKVRKFGDGLDEFYRVIDRDNGKSVTVADRVTYLGDKFKGASDKINGGTPQFREMIETLDRLGGRDRAVAIDFLGDSVDKFGDATNRGGGKATAGSKGFRDMRAALGSLEKGGGLGIDVLDGIGDSIGRLGDNAGKGGDGAGRGAKGFAALNGPLRTLSGFDPFDNPLQLFALIIALAPQVAVLANAAGGGILILAGALTALGLAGVGYGIGFSNLFGDLNKLDPAIRPAAKALQGLGDDFDDLRLNLQKQIFSPAVVQQFEDFGDRAFKALDNAFSKIGPALSTVLEGVSRDLNSSGFKRDLEGLFTGLEPSIKSLGGILRNTFGIIGELLTDATPYVNDFTREVEAATGKFLTFLRSPEGKRSIQDFLDGATKTLKDVGDAAVVLGGALVKLITPANVERTGDILRDLAGVTGDLIALSGALADLNEQFETLNGGSYADEVVQEFKDIGQAAEDMLTAFGNIKAQLAGFFLGVQNQVNLFVETISSQFAAVGKAFTQVASGDFAGAARTLAEGFKTGQDAARTFGDNLKGALGDSAALFRGLDSTAQTQLTALAGRFDIPKGKTQEFGGEIAKLAAGANVDLGKIAGSTSWAEIGQKLGLTGTQVNALKQKYGELPDMKSTKVEAVGATQADVEVQTLKNRIATLADKVVNVKADGPKPSFKDVSDLSTSIGALVGKSVNVKADGPKPSTADVAGLAGSIGALVGKTVPVKEDGAVPAKGRVTDLTGSINALKGKTVDVHEEGAKASDGRVAGLIGQIGALKGKTVGVDETGAKPSQGRVSDLMGQINALKGKTVQVTADVAGAGAVGALAGAIAGVQSKTVYVDTVTRKYANEFGGVMAGGRQIAGGKAMAFASGGILNRPTFFGNVLAGEAGAEAIVPLTGSLSKVDKSVRALSAYARGASGYTVSNSGKSVQVARGAVQITTANPNAEQVASAVLDRLTIRAGL